MAESTSDQRVASLLDRVKDIAGLLGPVTLVTALLVYFGYIGTRARFDYFGVHLDLADLSNQALILYGLEVAFVPAALVFLVMLLIVGVHTAVTWLLTKSGRGRAGRVVGAVAIVAGLALLARALVGIFVPDLARREVPGTTALALASGPTLVAYGFWTTAYVSRRANRRFALWYTLPTVARLRRLGVAAVVGLAVAGLFWAANSFAWAFGAGRGYDDAVALPRRPEVILNTTQRLTDLPAGVTETTLAGDPSVYHYRGFRLLLSSGGRLFLVPERWTAASYTTVVPAEDALSVQLVPQR
jgi:hypothetical protein